MNAKCAKCGYINNVPDDAKKFCCSSCGVLNTPQPDTAGTGDQACGCLLPERHEFFLPSGKITDPRGALYDQFLTADDGTSISREKWIRDFGYDPEIIWQNMRKQGKEGVEGYVNLSTLGKRRK